MMMMSVPIMSIVLAVSRSDSPFATDEPVAEILADAEPIYFDASSKESLVLVLFS